MGQLLTHKRYPTTSRSKCIFDNSYSAKTFKLMYIKE